MYDTQELPTLLAADLEAAGAAAAAATSASASAASAGPMSSFYGGKWHKRTAAGTEAEAEDGVLTLDVAKVGGVLAW